MHIDKPLLGQNLHIPQGLSTYPDFRLDIVVIFCHVYLACDVYFANTKVLVALDVCHLHMEEYSPMKTATSGAPNVLRNEVVRLYIATTTQQLDIVSNVCVEDCNLAVNGFVAHLPVSPKKYEVGDCCAYAEYAVHDDSTRSDILHTLPEHVRPPAEYVSKMKVLTYASKEGTSFKPYSERQNMPVLGIVLTG